MKQTIPPVVEKKVMMPIPPHVGVGDEDDSIGECALVTVSRYKDKQNMLIYYILLLDVDTFTLF